MYRPYGDDPNQELYAGDASSKPLTDKQRAALQLELMTKAAMNKPPTGLAQLANNTLNDPTVKTILYLLGLGETVITALATAVRNPGALPTADLAKATFDRLRKGYTYADLYKTAGYNPGTAELLGLGASLTSPVGEKSTAVRATQGAMKAGADALAAAGNAGVIGKNAVAQTLMKGGYRSDRADDAERAIAGFTSGDSSRLGMGLTTYWRYNQRGALGPYHALGQTSYLGNLDPLDVNAFNLDLQVVQAGMDYFKESARQGQKVYIYRSAPGVGNQPVTGHSAQESDGTFFSIDPHVAISYALGASTHKASDIVEVAIDPKKVMVIKPIIIRSDDPKFIEQAYEAERQLGGISQVQSFIASNKQTIARIDVSLKPIYQTIIEWGEKIKKDPNLKAGSVETQLPAKLLALVQKAEVDEPGSILSTIPHRMSYDDLVKFHQSLIDGRRRIVEASIDQTEQVKALQEAYAKSGAKSFLERAKQSNKGKYGVMMTPQWDQVAAEAKAKGYDAVFNPTTGEVVVLNVSRGNKPSPIQEAMSTARVFRNLEGANIRYPANVIGSPKVPFDSATQYPIPQARSENENIWKGRMDNVDYVDPKTIDWGGPIGFPNDTPMADVLKYMDRNDPLVLANQGNFSQDSVAFRVWQNSWQQSYRDKSVTPMKLSEAIKHADKLRAKLAAVNPKEGVPYELWFEIATGMPYQDWLKTQTK